MKPSQSFKKSAAIIAGILLLFFFQGAHAQGPAPTITSFAPQAAVAGATVTINGTNLTGATAVSFDGVPATSYTVVSATQIQAIVPSGGSGAISVTTPGGTTSLTYFTSIPVITSFTPTQGTQGTIMIIKGTSFTGINSLTIGGVTTGYLSLTSTEIKAVVGAGATGSVTVSKAGGYSSSLPGFGWYAPPVITGFAPASGPVGGVVTITGTGFNSTPANNIVHFGAVKASVTGGSATSLTVTVPAGASFEPIRVISNNLIAHSAKPFLVTFADGGSITTNSFANKTVVNTAPHVPMHLSQGDLDGDGKTDLIVSKYRVNTPDDNGFLLYRNTSTSTVVSFASAVNMVTRDYRATAIGDMDGDGKADIVVAREDSLIIYLNTSSPGNLSFAVNHKLLTEFAPVGLAIADMDGDGKADVVINGSGTAFYRNISNPGSLDFATPRSTSLTGGRCLLLTDLDGDGKPDVVGSEIMRNKSTKGYIDYSDPLPYPIYRQPWLAAGDIDGDGKTDLVVSDINGSRVGVLRNTSSGTTISFADPVDMPATSTPDGIAVSDLDGDGKPDIAVALNNYSLAVYKNNSSAGTISFSPKVDYATTNVNGNHKVLLADINNDGKADAVVSSETGGTITVHINEVKPEPFIRSFTPTMGDAGTVVTITGANFTGVAGVSFGGVQATSVTVNSPSSITAVVGTGGTGAVSITNNYGAGSLAGFVFGTPPVITAVAPVTGAIGSAVTITGHHFSPVMANNIVYFGGVKAVVTAATDQTLTVTVPVGAGYLPITVTTGGRTAYSTSFFTVSFPGGGPGFSPASFSLPTSWYGGAEGMIEDLDGDGKPDLAMGAGTDGIAVAINKSEPGNILFTPKTLIPVGANVRGVVTADLDGDGRKDIVTYNYSSQSISLMRNISTAGTIAMGTPVTYLTGPSTSLPDKISVKDIDLDGRPDVVVANYQTSTVSVFKNESTGSTLALAPRIDYTVYGYPMDVTLNDLDGDGKPDMLIGANSNSSYVTVFPNTSTPGTISFGNKLDLLVATASVNVKTGDLDGDGKPDVAGYGDGNVVVLRNQSTPGNISFAARKTFAGGIVNDISMGDLDGDGKAEIVTYNGYITGHSFSVFKNESTPGNMLMQAKVDWPMNNAADRGNIADLDGDGRPDVAVEVSNTIYFYRNIIGTAATAPFCANGGTTLQAGITGTTYQWQQNTGAGFANITNNANFAGSTSATLQLLNIPIGWNNYEYRCMVNGTQAGIVYKLTMSQAVAPSVSVTASATNICTGTNVTFTASPTNGGIIPTYQWKKNGVNAGTNSPTFSSNSLQNGDVIGVELTSTALCATPATVNSNTYTMVVGAATAAISINGNTTVQQDQVTMITATPTNGGPIPVYQWQDSTDTHSWANISGAQGSSISYKPTLTGVKLRCILTSNAGCVTTNPYTSNVLVFTVNPVTAIDPVPAASYGIRYFPNPVTNTLIIDSLKLSDRWEMLTITSADGRQKVYSRSISGQIRVSIPVTGLANGYYVAILHRKQGVPVYLKFIKQ